jgi:antirestriction protein ArdC
MNESVYQVITDRIISLLEKNVVPWHQPWTAGQQAPQNLISRKPYRGVNTFLLSAMQYQSPYWLSFKQADALGGHVRRGEKSCPVTFWKWVEVENKETGGKEKVPFLRYYSVFNVVQCEDIPLDRIPALEASKREHSPITEAERIVGGMPQKPEIKHGMAEAYYCPSEDFIGIPAPERFTTGEYFYSVLFHEMIHSTSHPTRLNRKAGWSAYGSDEYAKEELIAEFGAAFLCAECGISRTLDNSAAYLASWVQRFKDDATLVVRAAAQAQKAADFILNRNTAEGSLTEVQSEAVAA